MKFSATQKWVIGGLLALVGSLGGTWANHVSTELRSIKKTQANYGARITAIERDQAHAATSLGRVEKAVLRLEEKIDRLIELRLPR